MAVKIKLKRIGKMRNPQYRIVVADARTKRDGRAIEEIGLYHPKEEPSLIKIDSERAQYWLGVGAQPTEAVARPARSPATGRSSRASRAPRARCRWPRPRPTSKSVFEAAALDAANEPAKDATTPKKKAAAAEAEVAEESHRSPRGRCRGRSPRRRRPPRPPRRLPPEAAQAARRGRRAGRGRREHARPDVLEEALEHLVKGIVDNPDDVDVRERATAAVRDAPSRSGCTRTTSVASSAVPGRHRHSLRTVIDALAGGHGVRVDFVDVERALTVQRRGRRPHRQAPRHPWLGDRRRAHRRARAPVCARGGRAGPGLARPPPCEPPAGTSGRAPAVRAARTATHAEELRGVAPGRGRRPGSPDDPEEFYDHQLRGLDGPVDGARRWAWSTTCCTCRHRTCSRSRARAAQVLVPFVAEIVPVVDLAGGFSCSAGRSRKVCATMRIDVVSIFPGVPGAAAALADRQGDRARHARPRVHDLRDHAHDRHRTVDDTPYGGGPGMVMSPSRGVRRSILAQTRISVLIIPTPSGAPSPSARPRSSPTGRTWSSRAGGTRASTPGSRRTTGLGSAGARGQHRRLRARRRRGGGARDVSRSIARLLPGVLGNPDSVADDSFSLPDGLVEGPAYTRPPVWRGLAVPDVLLSGDHGRIQSWREQQARLRTQEFRGDG